MIARVDYVILYVAHLDRSIAFYRELIGLQLKVQDHGYAEFVTQGTKSGAEILAGPTDRPRGHRTLHLLDPDGFVVELAQEIERARHSDDLDRRSAPSRSKQGRAPSMSGPAVRVLATADGRTELFRRAASQGWRNVQHADSSPTRRSAGELSEPVRDLLVTVCQ